MKLTHWQYKQATDKADIACPFQPVVAGVMFCKVCGWQSSAQYRIRFEVI